MARTGRLWPSRDGDALLGRNQMRKAVITFLVVAFIGEFQANKEL